MPVQVEMVSTIERPEILRTKVQYLTSMRRNQKSYAHSEPAPRGRVVPAFRCLGIDFLQNIYEATGTVGQSKQNDEKTEIKQLAHIPIIKLESYSLPASGWVAS